MEFHYPCSMHYDRYENKLSFCVMPIYVSVVFWNHSLGGNVFFYQVNSVFVFTRTRYVWFMSTWENEICSFIRETSHYLSLPITSESIVKKKWWIWTEKRTLHAMLCKVMWCDANNGCTRWRSAIVVESQKKSLSTENGEHREYQNHLQHYCTLMYTNAHYSLREKHGY